MITYLIGLISSYLSFEMCFYWFFPFIALSFLTVFPRIIRSMFTWG